METPSGLTVRIVMCAETTDRLYTTCFRGKQLQLAGNLRRFDCPGPVFHHALVKSNLLKLVDVLWRNGELGRHSVDFDCGEPIGWESTSPVDQFAKDELEHFFPNDNPNSKWWGQRVRPCLTDICAPVTSLLTIRFQLENQHEQPALLIGSIYPGVAIGVLAKDVTEETGRVFFDWNHPGAPWPN